MTVGPVSWPLARQAYYYVQLYLVIIFLLFYSCVSGENDDEITGNFFLDILVNIWSFLVNLFSGGPPGTNCDNPAARCGLWGLFYLSHTGLPGTSSCQEECVFWAPPPADQCGGCERRTTLAPTSSAPTPAPPITASPVRNETPSSFDITLDLSLVPLLDHSYFTNAAARWERVITGDLAPVKTYYFDPKYAGCTHPANRQIDDLYICARYAAYDGPGGVVGYGEPDWTRGLRGLPASGYMTLDEVDIAVLKRDNILQALIEHEIGHILGIGTQWYNIGVVGPGNYCPYVGPHANSEYQALTGCAKIPTELSVGPIRCTHFDEDCLDNELMTGYINSDKINLLTRLTVATLEDLGYEVDYAEAADFASLNIPSQCLCGRRRSLVAIRQIMLSLSDSVAPRNSSRCAQLSDEMRSYAIQQGQALLREQAKQVPRLDPNWNEGSNVNADDLPTFVGDQFVSMWVQDKDNGEITNFIDLYAPHPSPRM